MMSKKLINDVHGGILHNISKLNVSIHDSKIELERSYEL